MPDRKFGTKPLVKLGGNRLPSHLEANVLSVTVETDLTAPGACLVTLVDPDRSVLDTIGVNFLDPIEIQGSSVEDADTQPLFTGEVYGFDFAADDTGCFALIRAYDAAYKLKQHRGIASFNDVNDGDVVRQLAGDAGVDTGTVDGGHVTHRYLAQMNQTHWDFLQQRAAAGDRVLRVNEGRLDFTTAPEASSGPSPGDHGSADPLQLTAGHNLVYLRVRATAAQQVEEVEVRGWDPATKEAVVATSGAAARGAQSNGTDPASLGADHGSRTRVAPFPGLTTQAEGDALAASVGQRQGASFTYAEGQALGDPRLQAGVAVSLGQTGRFDGRYTLTSVRHVFDDKGYHTFFRVSGEHDRSLRSLANGDVPHPHPRFEGVYPAIVTNLDDPDSLGRVKLSLPWLAEDYESDWARVMQLGAGPDRGILWFPEVNDEVVVSFLAGDPSRPLVIGGLYNGSDTPPFEGFADPGDGQVDTRCLKTRIGHTLVFQDRSGEESITLETGDSSVTITLDQANKALKISSSGDVEVEADGNVTVTAGRDLTLEANGSATVKANRSLTLESRGDVTVSGLAIKLN